MRTIRVTLALLVVAFAVHLASAQSGGLKVVVVDGGDQSPLPGATVVLSNEVQLVGEEAQVTKADGVAEFPILRPGGGYIISVTMPGYTGIRKDGIRVKISETQTVVIPLGEEFTEVEKVVATSEVVELEKTSTSTSFGDEFIQDLPVQGRFYTNVLTLAPGVQDEDGDGEPNVHGARERDFATIVGGVSNVDPLTGLQLQNVNIDSIEEVEVITAGAGVEFGRAQGGFANIIEKQGSNEFEGLFNFIFRSGKLDGNGATNITGDRVPDFDWLQPAIQVSGPIVRDKLWYRLSHEYLKREDPVNTLSSLAVTTTTRQTSSDMITWQASRRNKLAFSFLQDPQEVENIGVSSVRPPDATATIEVKGPTYRVSWTAPYSSKLLVDSLIAYQDIESEVRPSARGVPNDCITGLDLLQQAQCLNLVTGQVSGSFFFDRADRRQRFTADARATIFGGRFWGMSHQFKLGFRVENERYFRELERRPDLIFFVADSQNDPTGGAGGSINRIGIVSATVSVPTLSRARAVGTNWAFFAEDQIKPLSNLTITLGARVDREIINSNGFLPFDPGAEAKAFADALAAGVDAQQVLQGSFTAYEGISDFVNQLADTLDTTPTKISSVLNPSAVQSTFWSQKRRLGNIDITNTNFSPFLSVSWDPFKTNKTKFAFSAGRKYDKIFLAIPTLELNPITTDLNFTADLEGGKWQVNDLCANVGACLNPAANVNLVDRNLKTPYNDEFTFTFERELAAETALSVTYLRRSFKDQFQDIDLNHLPGDFGRCQLQTSPSVPPLVPSPGEGQELVDPFDGEVYIDTDPGVGDGRFDDCIGELVPPEGNQGDGGSSGGGAPSVNQFLSRPDGFADAYILNPGWGEIFLVGNFNTAEYRGVVVELDRRQYRNWQMNASYTWSEAIGDAEDFNQGLGDDRSIVQDERGFLSYDQRHVVKVNATTIVPWAGGFRFGTTMQWQSGYPYSILNQATSVDAIPPDLGALATPEPRFRRRYVTRQRNDQRNEGWWNFDVHLAKEMTLRGGINLQVTGDIFNLLNDDTLRVFGQSNGFNAAVRRFGRRYQVGLRLAF